MAANTIGSSKINNISIFSGSGNTVFGDEFLGPVTGSASFPTNYDISVGPGANGGIVAPVLTYASLSPDGKTLNLGLAGLVTGTANLEVYLSTAASSGGIQAQRTFLGEAPITTSNGLSTAVLSLPSSPPVSADSQIVATETIPVEGTSEFSAPITSYLATTVTNTNAGGPGSLASAIAAATPASHTVSFAIAGTGPFTIKLASSILVTLPVVIDGTTEPTATITIDSGGTVANGLVLAAGSDGSVVEGLQFQSFTGAGLVVESSNVTIGGTSAGAADVFSGNGVLISGGSAAIVGDRFGVDAFGNLLGSGTGIMVTGGSATIGGTTGADGNTIASPKGQVGVSISGGTALVEANLIGVDALGQSIGGGTGILLSGTGSQIGGSTTAEANTIGFNATGISISGNASSNTVSGNEIGTNSNGVKLGNSIGIVILGSNNMIGGSSAGSGNTIGFNGTGVSISGNASNNVVQQNLVGTDSIGHALGNVGVGILIDATDAATGGSASVHNNTIGGTASGAGNTIGFNGGAGIAIEAVQNSSLNTVSASNNLVQGNDIGGVPSDSTSPGPLVPSPYPNGGPGILLMAQGPKVDLFDNTIGGPATVTGPAGALGVGANFILGNQRDGIAVSLAGAAGSLANTIEGNLVSHNQFNGIHLVGDLTGATALGTISDNLVGTNPSGTATYDSNGDPWGNGLSGILIEESSTSTNTLGGTAVSVTGNVLSGNGLSGVTVQRYTSTSGSTTITGTSTAKVGISGNIIGLDRTGKNSIVYNSAGGTTTGGVALPMGNALDGVLLDNVVGVVVGSTLDSIVPTTPSNVISGNLGRGIEIRGDLLSSHSTSPGNTIQGNFIGTDISGEVPVQAAGVVDHFRMRKLRIFGPTRAAARLESSKAYAKEFMQRHGIPTAGHRTFTDPAAAHAYIDERACALEALTCIKRAGADAILTYYALDAARWLRESH